ncbi:virginiamycin B lyase family protein [Flavobacterium ajazii]|uniref:virginiamycin B lyase family protein n=1 Tax=Flavobacterium ajazii TaxID=2692318 RepID=UPI0013D6023A|nr:T9SS type A sorting domain-containing protein [Flavobacterium ajazii]
MEKNYYLKQKTLFTILIFISFQTNFWCQCGTIGPTANEQQIYTSSATIANLTATGTNLKWYAAATGGTALATTTSLTNNLTYYVSQTVSGCESARTPVLVRSISETAQTLCGTTSPTFDSVITTPNPGTTAAWFSNNTGGTALSNTQAIMSSTYYVEQKCPLSILTLGSGFLKPYVVTVQPDGRILVVDTFNNVIKRMNADGTDIVILGGGFNFPVSAAIQADGKILVADYGNNAIKRMNADGTGIVTIGSGFFLPAGVAIQTDGKIVVADYGNSAVKRMNANGTGIVTLGSGFKPNGVAIQANGRIVVADYGNNAIKRMNADGTGIVTLGSGFSSPTNVAIQADGKIVVADYDNNAVKRMNADGTNIVTLDSGFPNPYGVAIQADGKILVVDADYASKAVKRITEAYSTNRVPVNVTVNNTPAPTATETQIYTDTSTIASLAATGTGLKWYAAATGGSNLATTTSLTNDATYYVSQTVSGCESTRTPITVHNITDGTQTFCSMSTPKIASFISSPSTNATVSWFSANTGGTALTSTEALTTKPYYVEQRCPAFVSTLGSGFKTPYSIATQTDGKILMADTGNALVKRMNADGTAIITLGTGFTSPCGIAVQADGKIIVADAGNNAIKRMNADGSNIVTLSTAFSFPTGVAIQADGKIIVADYNNNAVKRMNADGTGVAILGTGFKNPSGIAIQADGKIIVADLGNNTIKRMNADGTGVVTLGSGFNSPRGVAIQNDNKIVIADQNNNAIKRMNADGTGIETLGKGFKTPFGVALQTNGKILVADYGNNALKSITEPYNSNRAVVNAIVNTTPAPTVATPVAHCLNASPAALTASGTKLLWYTATDLSGSSTAPTPSTTTAGTTSYWVTQTVNGCESPKEKIDVVVTSSINNIVTLTGGELAANQENANYQWIKCSDNSNVGTNSRTYSPIVSDSYKVIITMGSCSVTSACTTVSSLGTTDFETITGLTISPNPSKGMITIQSRTSEDFQIINLNGQVLKSFTIKADTDNLIDLQNLTNGVYIIKGKNKSYKLLIEK